MIEFVQKKKTHKKRIYTSVLPKRELERGKKNNKENPIGRVGFENKKKRTEASGFAEGANVSE